MKKVAIIGCGLQANRRASSIIDGSHEIVWVVDRNLERAEKFGQQFGARSTTDWRSAIADPIVDLVLILTYPDSHKEIAIAAFESGKHVFCEKPLSRTAEEAREMCASAVKNKRILRCGFNHRFHPAVQQAYKLYKEGVIGKAVFGRGRYGIAGREGVEKEWRSNPKIVSGGQLMEQGIHLVDLFRAFLGEINEATGMTSANHWPIEPLEDNGFALLKSADGVIASVHSSLTQWINLFEFEIYGERGSITVHGLGASYGIEKLIVSKHDPSGPFAHETIEFRGGDISWRDEWKSFVAAVRDGELSSALGGPQLGGGDGIDGLRAIEIVDAVYKAAELGETIHLGLT